MHNYMDIIQDRISDVYKDGVATKILTFMDRIRNVSDEGQARRWVMELMQNSQDCAYEDQNVRIRIEYDRDSLRFSHNGKPFRVKDVLSIVNQVSSKSGDKDTVGQFGTGFISTYQLSSVVRLKSVLKEDGLPYVPFEISLDRSGTDKDAITEEIQKTMEGLKHIDESEEIADFVRNALNTEFTYMLQSDYYRNVARIGMEDLKETIHYVLLFSGKIGEVLLTFHEDGIKKNVLYRAGEERDETGELCFLTVEEITWEGERDEPTGDEKKNIARVVYLKDDEVTVACVVDDRGHFHPLSEKLPRLFVDFPLIGAEKFPFPVVVNCRYFKVNEPRSGITLVDNENSKDAKENKGIIDRAVKLYSRFLRAALESGFEGLENIVFIPEWQPDKELSEDWIKKHIYEELFRVSASLPMIRCEDGMRHAVSETGVFIPDAIEPDEKTELAALLSACKGVFVPIGEEDWLRAFSNYPGNHEKRRTLRQIAEEAEAISSSGLKEERISWLQKLYDASMKNQELKTAIQAGQIRLFPRQSEDNSLCAATEICKDPEIPGILKDVADILDALDDKTTCEIRKKLLHPEFHVDPEVCREYNIQELTSHIIHRSDRWFPVKQFTYRSTEYMNLWHRSWKLLISCGPDRKMYDIYAIVRGEALDYKDVSSEVIAAFMWKSCYKSFLAEILGEISKCKDLQHLREHFPRLSVEEEMYHWLNDVYEEAEKYLDSSDIILYPDQEGTFRSLHDLKKDEIEYEELKQILNAFSDIDEENRIFRRLLDKKILKIHQYLSLCTDKELAQKIGTIISGILSHKSLSEETDPHQDACSRLLAWIQKNQKEAESYFPAFCKEEDQMKLLTPRAATRLQRDADNYQIVMELMGEKDPEKAAKKIRELIDSREPHEEDAIEGGNYDPDFDLYFGSDIDPQDEDVRREIGQSGERYAFSVIKNKLMDERWGILLEEQEGRCCSLVKDNIKATLLLADHGDYHQSGYDILFRQSEDGKVISEVYYEVKTHTPGSCMRGVIRLSNEQMIMAVDKKENYAVLDVVYDHRSRQGVSLEEYRDPIRLIRERKLQNTQKEYLFRIMGCEL